MRSSILVTVIVLASASVLPAQRPAGEPSRVARRPPAPARVMVAIAGPGRVQLTWDAVPGAAAYDIGRRVAPGGWRRVARVDSNTTSYVDAKRDLSQSHQYQVIAIIGGVPSLPRRSEPTSAAATQSDTT